ncbi:MAG: response regulator [Deltaproteobacteria bacterium]|nr:response regulator [Deltaproteobacteria bacterium]
MAAVLAPVVRERARVLGAAVFAALAFYLAGAGLLYTRPDPTTAAVDWLLLGVLGVLALGFALRWISERWVHHASMAALWCPMAATLLTFHSTGEPVFAILIALLIMSTGVLLHTPLVVGTIAVTDAIAIPLLSSVPHGTMWTSAIVTATLFALLIHILMRSALVRAEVHRLAQATTARELAGRVAELEQAHLERAALQDQLLHAQRMDAIGTLAAGVAHDMNNILFSISNLANLLLEDAAAPAARGDLDEIVAQAGRGAVLTRGLLTFSRRGQYRRQVVVLGDVIRDLIPLLRRTLPKSITIREDLDVGDARVDGDPVHIGQVILNLGLNAADAISGDGQLVVSARVVSGGRVRITVSDDGKGMDAATRARIFEPFFTTKPLGQGTGLGLSTVWGIVQAHDGTIEVDSAPGKGTSFHIELPMTASPRPAPSPRPRTAPLTSKGAALVVDDEPSIRESTRRHLERMGLSVTTAGNGVEALAAMFGGPDGATGAAFDLVVLDMGMPVMGGAECFRQIRTRSDVPILIATGYAHEREVQVLVAAGAILLEKPYPATDLQREVARLLRQRCPEASPALC